MRIPPSKQARCEKCHASLSYEIGSIAWQCADRDLCPSCEGDEVGAQIVAAMRAATHHQEPNDGDDA